MSRSYLLDTNVVIALFEQEAQVQARLSAAAEILLSSTVVGELHCGAASSGRSQQNLAQVEEFVASCTVLSTDAGTARLFGSIKAELKRNGRPLGQQIDGAWITAVVDHAVVCEDLWPSGGRRPAGAAVDAEDHIA